MDERDWTILHMLYEQKNITKTAQLLFLTQPALTRRITLIEEEFGVKIVNRGIRGVQFTQQGEYLAKRASLLLSTFQEIREEVLNLENDIVGTLRLGVSNFFGKYKLPGLLRRFKDQYPKVDFQVETGLSKDIFQLAYNQDVHIGFVRGDYSWPDQKSLLFEEHIVIVSKEPIRMEDLPVMPRIDFQTDILFKTAMDQWWAEHYSQPPNITMKVDRGDTCKEMVLAGLGYAIMPSMFLEDIQDLYTITLNDKENMPMIHKTWMIYYISSLENNVVRAFVDTVQASIE